MNVKLYQLSDQAVTLQPAADGQMWRKSHPALAGEPAYTQASQQGWDLLCPLAFAVTWNGGSRPEDIEIRLEGAGPEDAPSEAAFVQSNLGNGLLTFYPGYQGKSEDGYVLWLRGPINAPKDGLYPLENIVDAALLPCTVTIDWQFTRPHQTIRFAAGEPFATLLLYPKNSLAALTVEVMGADEGEDAYVQAFQQMVTAPGLQGLFQRQADPVAPAEPALTLPWR